MTQSLLLQMQQKAGVSPSNRFLTELLEALPNASPDVVLQQILHHDLRSVVRDNEREMPLEVNQLRTAVKDSQVAPFIAHLPESFRLLVQIEELLDVSQNAELRLSLGPTSPSDPSPIGNQQNRCLKLYLCDGYSPAMHLIAAEVTPLPNLSAHCLAGIKLLLCGPLQVRHGVLLLTTTAVVLGGNVTELVTIQRQALQQARQVAGVGIDPTVRALLNPEMAAALVEEGK
jgi:hypothetical protein